MGRESMAPELMSGIAVDFGGRREPQYGPRDRLDQHLTYVSGRAPGRSYEDWYAPDWILPDDDQARLTGGKAVAQVFQDEPVRRRPRGFFRQQFAFKRPPQFFRLGGGQHPRPPLPRP